jgi:hypothetical protein
MIEKESLNTNKLEQVFFGHALAFANPHRRTARRGAASARFYFCGPPMASPAWPSFIASDSMWPDFIVSAFMPSDFM